MHPFVRAVLRTRFVSAYVKALETHPLPTKCTTSGTLMVLSDGIRQKLEADDRRAPFRYDVARAARLTAFAICFHSPYLHAIHPWYERLWVRYKVRHTAATPRG